MAQEAPSQGAGRAGEDHRGADFGSPARPRPEAADGLTSGRPSTAAAQMPSSRDLRAVARRDQPVTRFSRQVPADRPRNDPIRAVDRAQARWRGGPQSGPATAPRDTPGDGPDAPARLGRHDHRQTGDRRRRSRRARRRGAADPPAGRSSGRPHELGATTRQPDRDQGDPRVSRRVRVAPGQLPLRAHLLPLHRTGDRQVRPAARQLDGRSPDRPLSPLAPGRLRPGPLNPRRDPTTS